MLNRLDYIRGVENQLDNWKKEIRQLSDQAGPSGRDSIDRIYNAKHLVENKINEFKIAGDEALGHWETEIDNLRHQVQHEIKSFRDTLH